jgi:hypothetical protein
MFAEFVVGLRVISCDFMVVFRLLTTIPRHLKIPWTFKQFSKSGIVGVSGVFDIKIHSF